MEPNSSHPATVLLTRMRAGDESAAHELMPLVYAELHALARSHMSSSTHHTLQPTALVNEAWLRMAAHEGAEFENRMCFFAFASRVMRTVLVDHARAKQTRKREGSGVRVTLNEYTLAAASTEVDLLAVNDALEELARLDVDLAKIVELRFFGGLTAEETARSMNVPLRSLERSWQFARLWLYKKLGDGSPAERPAS